MYLSTSLRHENRKLCLRIRSTRPTYVGLLLPIIIVICGTKIIVISSYNSYNPSKWPPSIWHNVVRIARARVYGIALSSRHTHRRNNISCGQRSERFTLHSDGDQRRDRCYDARQTDSNAIGLML